MGVLTQILAFVVTLLALVSVHEAGHFFMAKLLGVKVLRFSIGFGKPFASFYDRQGTQYAIALIPLGGYVKLLDERESPVSESEKSQAFNRKPIWVRVLVVLAGPAINLIFAVFGFWLMYMNGLDVAKPIVGEVLPHSIAAQAGLQKGDLIQTIAGNRTPSMQKAVLRLIEQLGTTAPVTMTSYSDATHQTKTQILNLKQWRIDPINPDPLKGLGIIPARPPIAPVIYGVEKNSPAQKANLQALDRVIALDQKPVKDWYQLIEYIQRHPGQPVMMQIKRGSDLVNVKIMIDYKHWISLKPVGYMGIRPSPVTVPRYLILKRQYSPLTAFTTAVDDTWQYLKFNFILLKKLILGQISLNTLGGPISIFTSADIAFQQGFSVFLGFLSLISIMLAFVNLLPIPGLDGGHLLNFAIEGIIRKPLSLQYEFISAKIGLVLLLFLMLLATYNDILRLLLRS